MGIQTVTAVSFDEIIAQHALVLIDFGATWCAPCQTFAKVLEAVMPEYPDVYFGAVDIDAEKELAQNFAVTSVPFVMIVRDQVVVYAESGLLPASALRELLDQARALTKEQLQQQ